MRVSFVMEKNMIDDNMKNLRKNSDEKSSHNHEKWVYFAIEGKWRKVRSNLFY